MFHGYIMAVVHQYRYRFRGKCNTVFLERILFGDTYEQLFLLRSYL